MPNNEEAQEARGGHQAPENAKQSQIRESFGPVHRNAMPTAPAHTAAMIREACGHFRRPQKTLFERAEHPTSRSVRIFWTLNRLNRTPYIALNAPLLDPESARHDHVCARSSGKRRKVRSVRARSSEPPFPVGPERTDSRPQPLAP